MGGNTWVETLARAGRPSTGLPLTREGCETDRQGAAGGSGSQTSSRAGSSRISSRALAHQRRWRLASLISLTMPADSSWPMARTTVLQVTFNFSSAPRALMNGFPPSKLTRSRAVCALEPSVPPFGSYRKNDGILYWLICIVPR